MKIVFPLIPRVRVNYNFRQIIGALFIRENNHKYSNYVKNEICKIFDTNNILLTSSGRSGLYLILKSLPQSKVIIPAYTCKVIEEAVLLTHKKVIYAKTSSDNFNVTELPPLDNDTIVIATHQYGIPCNIEEIASVCKRNNALLVEDCAASLGTLVNGKMAGLYGDYSFFSFDSSKLINTPSKGGFIIAKNEQLLENIKTSELLASSLMYKLKHLVRGFIYCLLKNKFVYRMFHYLTMGRKGKMHIDDTDKTDIGLSEFYTHGFYEWQAYITYPQLKNISEIISKRDYIYRYYNEKIKNPIIKKPPYVKGASCIRYTIQVSQKKTFYEACLNNGVDMAFSFNHISAPTYYIEEHKIADEILNVPFYYNISHKEMSKVVDVLNSIK